MKLGNKSPNMITAELIRAYAQSILDANGSQTINHPPLLWAKSIVGTDDSSGEAVCHMGRAMLLIEDSYADPPYRLNGEMCDPRKTEIARRLGMI
jgi:hypothetical protein